jgi:hypothetical protein
VPAATPLPRGPSVLTLYSAADLLTAPGCPVCRYAAEVDDRYLRWFALEGHAEPTMITVMCASLGMCAQHTRRLASQPGAATRLTAVYRYVLGAARELLASPAPAVHPCPACQRVEAAAGSALETLLDGLSDAAVRGRCRDLGGVCLPHVSAALDCGPRRAAEWLADTISGMLTAGPAVPRWLSGTDPDAETRAVLRRGLPAGDVPGACAACLAAVQAERDSLARLIAQPSDLADSALELCRTHLADAASAARGPRQLRAILSGQAASLAEGRGRWRRSKRTPGCLVCRTAGLADRDALTAVAPGPDRVYQHQNLLCVRHYFALKAADKRAATTLAASMDEFASLLVGELAEAFEQSTWAGRHGGPATQSVTWQRAAAFLDGAVFGGCPSVR